MVNSIGFDLGYTLVYLEREVIFQKYLREKYQIDKSFTEVEKAYHLTDKLFMRTYQGTLGKKGANYMPWYLGVLNYQLGIGNLDLIEEYQGLLKYQQKSRPWVLYPQVKDVLTELRTAGYKLVLISNWDDSASSLLDKLDLKGFFEQITISVEIGFEKPAPQIFEYTFQAAGIKPADFIYIGDNYYDDVLGARRAGSQGLLINRFGKLGIEEIKGCTVLSSITELRNYLMKGKFDEREK